MSKMQKYPITCWCGVNNDFIRHSDGTLAEERLAEMKEAGLNLILAHYGRETNQEVLAAAEKLSLRVTVLDNRIDRAVAMEEGWQNLLAETVNDYKDYPALFNYHIVDEPNSGAFPRLAAVREELSRLDPAHEAYYNLFPNYASTEMLGNPTYYDHVHAFADTVRPEILSYDHYHFVKGEEIKEEHDFGDDTREKQIYEAAYQKVDRPGFFENLEDVRRASQETGIPFMIILLVVEHGCYRYLTEAEIRSDVFQSLAYGSARISYFTYWTPGKADNEDFWHWKHGMIEQDGTRSQHYTDVKSINIDLQQIGDILMEKKNLSVSHLDPVPACAKAFAPDDFLDEATGENLTLGAFEGGYLLAANKNFEAPTVFRFVPANGKNPLHYNKKTGTWRAMRMLDGQYVEPIAPGDGELFALL